MRSLASTFAKPLLLLSCLTAAAAPATAQVGDYPKKTVTIVVPYSAGGLSDMLARDMANQASKQTGQSFVVLNKPGGAAQLAMAQLKENPADGYTLFVGDIAALALNEGLFSKLSYNSKMDLAPITQLVDSPILLVVNEKGSYKSVQDVVDAAKTAPKGLSYASQGVGTGGHLFGTLLAKKLDAPMTHIAYRGAVEGLQSVVSGEVDFMYDAIPSSGPLVKGERLRAIAVGSRERTPLFPDVPTLQELGYGDIGPSFWWGVVGKAGTPEPILDQLNKLFIQAINDPVVSKKYMDLGLRIQTSSPDEFKQYISDEIDRWAPVIKAAGMQVN